MFVYFVSFTAVTRFTDLYPNQALTHGNIELSMNHKITTMEQVHVLRDQIMSAKIPSLLPQSEVVIDNFILLREE